MTSTWHDVSECPGTTADLARLRQAYRDFLDDQVAGGLLSAEFADMLRRRATDHDLTCTREGLIARLRSGFSPADMDYRKGGTGG